MLQAKVACPLATEALYQPAQAISAKLTGASAELAKQLRYISTLDDPAVAAAGDDEEEDFSVEKLAAHFSMDGTVPSTVTDLKNTLILGDKALEKFDKFQEKIRKKDNQFREYLDKEHPKTYKGIQIAEGVSNWIMQPDPVSKVILGKVGEGFEWVENNVSEKVAKYLLPKIGINEGDEGSRTGKGIANFAVTSAIGGVAGKTLKVGVNAYKASKAEANILKAATKIETAVTGEGLIGKAKNTLSNMPPEYLKLYNDMVKVNVENLVKNNMIKLNNFEPAAIQIAKITDKMQGKFLKYQNFDDWAAHPYKMKIVGNAQSTGTIGHAEAITKLANKYAPLDEVATVFLDQGINKITNVVHPTNIRPDLVIVYKSGKIDFIEVMSKTDKFDKLKVRVTPVMKSFPDEMQGEVRILKISKTLEE